MSMRIEKTHGLTTVITAIACLFPDTAAAKNYQFSLSANVEGATVEAINARAQDSLLGSCATPCVLKLNRDKIEYFVFKHPEYPNTFLPIEDLNAALAAKTDVALRGIFGKSHAEIYADTETAFWDSHRAKLDAALRGPDTKATPIRRTPPKFPHRAAVSGWCHMVFDVSDTGYPLQVVAKNCSDPIFETESVRGIYKWRFIPKVDQGRFVDMVGAETLISYRMEDEAGSILPPPVMPPTMQD